jgi:hypothetical protein
MQTEGNNYFVRDNEVIKLYIANKNREVKYKHSNAIIIMNSYLKRMHLPVIAFLLQKLEMNS